jgi:hypothetical protein
VIQIGSLGWHETELWAHELLPDSDVNSFGTGYAHGDFC